MDKVNTKFTIDEINFDEIYDLIDYDRTGSNSSSTLEHDSPKLNLKLNPSAKLSLSSKKLATDFSQSPKANKILKIEQNSNTNQIITSNRILSYDYDLQTHFLLAGFLIISL